MNYEVPGQKLEAHSLELNKPITAMCFDGQERYVIAIEGGEVFRLKKVGESFVFKMIFKSRPLLTRLDLRAPH